MNRIRTTLMTKIPSAPISRRPCVVSRDVHERDPARSSSEFMARAHSYPRASAHTLRALIRFERIIRSERSFNVSA